MDEEERIYAPEALPPDDPQAARVRAEEGAGPAWTDEPPAAAPVANMGNAPSAAMAPPNIGRGNANEAPGTPDPVARDPLDTDHD
jgi:hypothetical protein